MKKNISINISGIIFHIEEDGYDSLKKYLDSIHSYFGTFEDSSEILADIESRIAELFLSKLVDGKQVITAEDVESLQSTMGNVSDFKAAEEQEVPFGATTGAPPPPSADSQAPRATTPPKRLFRDGKRKILGGIGAGLAHYFSIDPVWPRLLLALLAIGTSGVGLIVYIILWIVLPVAENLEEEPTVRKMFRDSSNKVLGGVASGVAAFFGTDITLIRVLFVVTALLGGFGFVIYLILWLSLPEAKSITEKMQMQGEPVTLSNIESSIKKGINEKEGPEESTFAKIILFPFRLLAAALNGLAKFLGPVLRGAVDLLRVGVGGMITFIGVMFILGLVICLGVAMGAFSFADWNWGDNWGIQTPNLPVGAIRNTFSGWLVGAAFFTVLIPLVFVTLLGISTIARRIVFNSYVGWGLFVLFFVSVAVLSFLVPPVIYGFKEEGIYKKEQVFEWGAKTAMLQVRQVGLDDYEVTDLTLKPYAGSAIKVVQYFKSQGRTKKDAIGHAQEVTYTVTQADSTLTFDSNVQFSDSARFRAQRLDVEVFIPEQVAFIIDAGLWRYIDNSNYRWRSDIGVNSESHTFKFQNGQIICVSCPAETESPESPEAPTDPQGAAFENETGMENFDAIDIRGLAEVRIQQGNTFAVKLDGPQELRDRYDISVVGQTLIIDYDDDRRFFWKGKSIKDNKVKIWISMPALRDLEMSGAGDVNLEGFKEDELDIELSGAVSLTGEFNAQNLTLDITGASSADIKGQGEFLEADITGASSLRGFGFEVRKAIVEAHGASNAKVFATESVEISKGMASSVSTKGGGQVIERN
jgi:phage shock protein PspC (stress-responsive transcriptional regulator)